MKFFTKYGGISTRTPWKRPTPKVIREWRDELSFDLTDWFVVGNVIEQFSSTWDVDIFLIQKPLKHSYNDLSDMFSEMLIKGFEKELLIDCAYMDKFYQDEWEPVIKIRPDKEFYKEMHNGVYHSVYEADRMVQCGPQLYKYYYDNPHDNWYKGKSRGYNFTGVSLKNF